MNLLTTASSLVLTAILGLASGVAALITAPGSACAAGTRLSETAAGGPAPARLSAHFRDADPRAAATLASVGAHPVASREAQVIALAAAVQESSLRHDEPDATRLRLAATDSLPSAGRAGPAASAGCAETALIAFTQPARLTHVTPAAATASSEAVDRAIAWAKDQLGTDYVYGGDCTAAQSDDPARHCDCSSLTQRAYAAAGITLPRTAAQQSHIGGLVPLDLDELQAGDLLFEAGADGTPSEPGHVSLYLGDGRLIEAPYTGATVRIARLTSSRAAILVAARRPTAPDDSDDDYDPDED